MAKMLANGDDKLLWVPDGGIDNVASPTVAELTAVGVVDISCLVTKANFSLGATGDAAFSDPALCSANDSTVPGQTSYEAAMDFFRWTVTLEDVAWTTFTGKGIAGFLAHRVGLPYTTAPAATQKFRIFGAITNTPVPLNPDAAGGFRKFRQAFSIQGEQVNERAVVAA